MTVLSPVEKLILYRKKYKISQKDLAGDSISRSHLAMIETGKNSLNDHTAAILVKNFNDILSSRGINDRILYDELMETKEMQVEKLKIEFLKKLEDSENLESTVSEIESYASEYDADTKIMLYKKMGDLFYERNNPHRATSFYLRIINDLIIKRDSIILGEISVTLVRIYLQTENYHAALDLENLIKSEIESFEEMDKMILLYNMGLINDFLKKHESALQYFLRVEEYIQDLEKIFDVKNYQALSYADLGEFDKAVSIYRSLMLKYKDPIKKISINDNLLYISKLEKNEEKIQFYYRKCKKILKEDFKDFQDYYFEIEQIEFSLAEIALDFSRKKDLIYFLLKVCENKTNRNLDIKFKAINLLLNHLSKKDIAIVDDLEELYFKLLSLEKKLHIGYEFLEFYIKENMKEKQLAFLNKIKLFY